MKNKVGFIGALAFAALAPLAHANFVIGYSVNGGAAQSCINNTDSTNSTGTTSCFSSATNIGGGVTVKNLTGSSDSPGNDPLFGSFQQNTDTQITTTSAATLTIWIAAQGFTGPTTPPNIDYSTSLTFIPTRSATVSAVLTSCVDESDGTVPPGGTFCSSPGATLGDTLSVTGPSSTSKSDNNFALITNLPTQPYSLVQKLVITLSAGSNLEIQTSQSLSSVPEPGSVSLLGGIALLTFGAIRRKMTARG